VNGFPSVPDGGSEVPSRNVLLEDVAVIDQHAAVTEVVAIDAGGSALIDPAGAVFQVRNIHPVTGAPITTSAQDDAEAAYVGNAVANAQALVAKAAALGAFEGSGLDVSRSNMPPAVLEWIEGQPGAETLADIAVEYLCNGDSMFHVNKGVIAFKMDAAENVTLRRTTVDGLVNRGAEGSTVCGDYLDGVSHPKATLHGYGGSTTRGATFAGAEEVLVEDGRARAISASHGPATGFAVMTDTIDAHFTDCAVEDVVAGAGGPSDPASPTQPAVAVGFAVSADALGISFGRPCAEGLTGAAGTWPLYDESGLAVASGTCPEAN